MSLEAKIELLTVAVKDLTHAIRVTKARFVDPASGTAVCGDAQLDEVIDAIKQTAETKPEPVSTPAVVPNAEPESSTAASSQASVQTGESSSPVLTYKDHVKPATLKLSVAKGRDTAIAVLARFGVKVAQDLAEAQWADYVAHVEHVINGGEV